jgi:general secretion pathway protein H
MRPSLARVPHQWEQGFTLLELLMVLFIAGIILSYAVLSGGYPSPRDRLEREARRLAALMELALEESILQSRELGVLFSPRGYRFMALNGDQWEALAQDRLLRARELPEGMAFELRIDDLSVELEPSKESEVPQVYLFSSGEITPFNATLRVAGADALITLSGQPDGKLELANGF